MAVLGYPKPYQSTASQSKLEEAPISLIIFNEFTCVSYRRWVTPFTLIPYTPIEYEWFKSDARAPNVENQDTRTSSSLWMVLQTSPYSSQKIHFCRKPVFCTTVFSRSRRRTLIFSFVVEESSPIVRRAKLAEKCFLYIWMYIKHFFDRAEIMLYIYECI